jgi:hypothetical protein
MNTNDPSRNERPFRVRRGRVDSVDLFEVKENELEMLANGGPTEIYLNFAIFLLSTAISCVTGLATATFNSDLIKNTFLFVSIIGIIGGLFLGILWWRERKSIKSIVTKIKNRIPIESTVDPLDTKAIDTEPKDEFAPRG